MRRDGCDSRSLFIRYRIAGSHHARRTCNKRRILSSLQKKLCQGKNKEIFDSPNQHNGDRFQQYFSRDSRRPKSACIETKKNQYKFLGWQGWRLGVWAEVNSQGEILFYEFQEKGLHRSCSVTPHSLLIDYQCSVTHHVWNRLGDLELPKLNFLTVSPKKVKNSAICGLALVGRIQRTCMGHSDAICSMLRLFWILENYSFMDTDTLHCRLILIDIFLIHKITMNDNYYSLSLTMHSLSSILLYLLPSNHLQDSYSQLFQLFLSCQYT